MTKELRLFLLVVGFIIASYFTGHTVAKEQAEDRLINIGQSVGSFVRNQQYINSVYDPAITNLVIKAKGKK